MAISGDVFTIPIDAEDGASPEFAKIGASAEKLIDKAGVAGIAINQNLELVKKAARAVQAVFDKTVGSYAAYEKALVGVGKTANLAGPELEQFGVAVQQLSKRVPLGTNALLDIGQTAGQLGVQGTQNLLLFTETIAKLDAATADFKGEQAATALTRILTVTGEGVGQVDRLASVFVQLGNNFAATEGEIARVANEVARAGAVYGVTSAQAAGFGAAIRQLGIRAELGGSVIARSFNQIGQAIADGGNKLKVLQKITGLTSAELRKSFAEDAVGTFQKFLEGLGRVSKAAGPTGVVNDLSQLNLKGEEVAKVLPVMATRADVLADALKQASDEFKRNTALNVESARAFNTLDARMKILGNTVDVVFQKIGKFLAPLASDVVAGLQKAAEAADTFVTALSAVDVRDLAESVANITLGLGGLTVAIYAANAAFGILGTTVVSMTTGLVLGPTIGTIAAQLWGATKAALAFAASAAYIALVTASFVALAVAVDVVARNLGKLDDLFTLVQGGFIALGLKAESVFAQIGIAMGKSRLAVAEFTESLGLNSDAAVISARKTIAKYTSDLAAVRGKQSALGEGLKEVAKGIDFGVGGQVVNLYKKLTDQTAEAAKKAKEESDAAAEAAKKQAAAIQQSAERAKELQKVLRGVTTESENMALDLEAVSGNRAVQIDIERRRTLATIDAKEKQLEAEDKISGKIREQLNLQRVYANAVAAAQLQDARLDKVKELVDQNVQLNDVVTEGDVRGVDLAKLKAQHELDAIDRKREELRQSGLLTDEALKQLAIQRELTKKKGQQNIDKAEKAAKPQLFDTGQVDKITGALGSAAGGIASGASALAATPLAFLKVADMILDAVLELIDLIPKIANKVAAVFNNLADLPMKLLDAFKNINKGIENFIGNFIPNVISAISDSFDEAIRHMSEGLSKAVTSAAEKIPQMLTDLVNRLPELAKKFGTALFRSDAGLLYIKFLAGLIRGVPKLVMAIIRNIPAIVREFVGGLVVGLKEIANDIGRALGLGKLFDLGGIEEQFSKVGDEISRSASQLFEVIDLEAAARGLDVADRIRNAISSSGNHVANLLQKLWDALVRIWQWISDNIIMPVINALRAVWDFVWDNILQPFINLLKDVWDFVWGTILQPFLNLLDGIWQWTNDNIVGPLVNGLTTVWNWVNDNVVSALKAGFDWVNTLKDKVIDKLVAGFNWVSSLQTKVIDKLTAGFTWVTDMVKAVNDFFKVPSWISDLTVPSPSWLSNLKVPTPGWLDKFVNAVKDLTSFSGFSMGGLVSHAVPGTGTGGPSVDIPGVGSVGTGGVEIGGVSIGGGGGSLFSKGGSVGTSVSLAALAHVIASAKAPVYLQGGGSLSKGTDVIPAMLTPGEFVVNRDATRRNLGLLSFINQSKGTVTPVNRETQISVVINTKTDLSREQIRREIVPALRSELKRASQNGELVLDKRGVR